MSTPPPASISDSQADPAPLRLSLPFPKLTDAVPFQTEGLWQLCTVR